jgi:hypothetical protein
MFFKQPVWLSAFLLGLALSACGDPTGTVSGGQADVLQSDAPVDDTAAADGQTDVFSAADLLQADDGAATDAQQADDGTDALAVVDAVDAVEVAAGDVDGADAAPDAVIVDALDADDAAAAPDVAETGEDAVDAPDAADLAVAAEDGDAAPDVPEAADVLDAADVPESPDTADLPDAADAGTGEGDAGPAKVDPCPFPAPPAAGEPGAACKQAKDCASNVCVDSSQGQICSSTCTICCPLGFACLNVSFTSVPVYACASTSTALCKPCNADGECQSATSPDGLCVQGDGGGFCGIACAGDEECPIGYDCKDAIGLGKSAKQCVPTSGECSCSAKAISLGATTTCKVANANGACSGSRGCSASGLSVCSAATPAPDVCNGLDDNCDGVTDNGATDTDKDGIADCVDGDIDNDGAANAGDCAPGDAAIHPGAAEVCNGVDDDCDGVTDNGATDSDKDGIADCVDGDIDNDGTANAGDCAPGDASIHPGAAEVCNGVDDDCDGVTDPAGAGGCSAFFADLDSDGFGTGASVCQCAADASHTASQDGDCDDANKSVHPGASEACNGMDDNCNGSTDEQGANGCSLFYGDSDFDMYGSPLESACLCAKTTHFSVTNALDCDDAAAAIHPGAADVCDGVDNNCDGSTDPANSGGCASYFVDDDKDGYGNSASSQCLCVANATYKVLVGGDCNDASAAAHPGAIETCDGVDNNCVGGIDEAGAVNCVTYLRDHDGDLYGVAADSQCLCAVAGEYTATIGGDCNDFAGGIHPNAAESCNGLDDNCDGLTDPIGSSGCTIWTADADGDGYGGVGAASSCACTGSAGYANKGGDCADGNASVHPNATEICNGIDDNCDAVTDGAGTSGCFVYYADSDLDGYGASASPQCLCTAGGGWTTLTGGDCNDANSSVHPGVVETCNGIDDNCNGSTDEGLATTFYADGDGDGYGGASKSLCAATSTYSLTIGGDCNDSSSAVHPGATETCNGIDDDCDGVTDNGAAMATYYQDADGDGYGNPNVVLGSCFTPPGYVANKTDCNDSSAAAHPGATETCNGIDDNCNGATDEGFTTTTYYQDADGDGYGNPSVSKVACAKPAGYVTNKTDCDDTKSSVNPSLLGGGLNESIGGCNNVDNDCDGYTDNGTAWPWYKDNDADGYGAASSGSKSVCIGSSGGAGYVRDGGDCDDTNPLIHPKVVDIFNNGIDEDCTGGDDNATSVCTAVTLFDFENGPQGWTVGGGWTWDFTNTWSSTSGGPYFRRLAYENDKQTGYPSAAGGSSTTTTLWIPNQAKFIQVDLVFANGVSYDSTNGVDNPDSSAKVVVNLNGATVQTGPYSAYDGSKHTLKLAVDSAWWKTQVPFTITVTTPNTSTDASQGYFIDNIKVVCN